MNILKKLGALVLPLALYGFISTGHIPSVQHETTNIAPPYAQRGLVPSESELELYLLPEATPMLEDDSMLPKAIQLRLALAKICVSEAGFQVTTNDCALIYQAIKTRSRTHQITLGMMRSYSPAVFNEQRTDARRWIAYLNASFTEPEHWSETVIVPWGARREAWKAVYEYAGNLIRTRPANPCDVRIDHWGAKGFKREEHLEAGWTIVQCGTTKNEFWTIP